MSSKLKKHLALISLDIIITISVLILFIFLFLSFKSKLLVASVIILEALSIISLAVEMVFAFKDQAAERKKDIIKCKKNTENEYNSLISIIENIESNEPFKNVLATIYNSFSNYIPYTHIGVALLEDDGKTIYAAYGVSGPQNPNLTKRLAGYKTDINTTSLLQILSSGMPRVINDLNAYLSGREIHRYNKILLEEGIKSSITFPLINNGSPIGIIFFSSNIKNAYRIQHIDFLKTIANSIMLSLEKNLFLEEMIVSSSLALATLADERDNETGEHLIRMKKYSVLLAELLMKEGKFENIINIDYLNELERFSPLHDIGKVAISDSILLKPGKLSHDEFEIMKTHTTYGGSVLRLADDNIRKHGLSVFGMGIDITEGHHEKWDGSGYPFGRSGIAIPLSARIVSVADVFDALTSKRPYKDALDFNRSVSMILEESGSHFDPRIIEAFKNNLDVFKDTYKGFKNSL